MVRTYIGKRTWFRQISALSLNVAKNIGFVCDLSSARYKSTPTFLLCLLDFYRYLVELFLKCTYVNSGLGRQLTRTLYCPHRYLFM